MRITLLLLLIGAAMNAGEAPQFTSGNQLVFPKDYREWIFLSSGLGMNYGPLVEGSTDPAPKFDNVFVNPAAYRAFLQTGKWPDKTMFVLEVRSSSSKGSINSGGHFQSEIVGIEAEVKDESRFPGKWAFFGFGKTPSTTKQIPTTARCYACHSQNGAVDNTFVQFYPVLSEVARQKGTLKDK